MEEELSLDNILETDDIENLFEDNETQDNPPPEDKEGTEKEDNTTEVNVDTLFTDKPESVGSGTDNIEEQEDAPPSKDGASPNFYSSITKALKEEGIFPDLEDDAINKIKAPEDFKNMIEEQIRSSLDERQKRIDEALNVGIEPTEIRKYENALSYLDSIDNDSISDESDKGETLRKQLIYQDFINRGYSKERASREVTKSFNAGSDIEDAKEALKSNKEFFQTQYDNLIEEAREEEKKENSKRQERAEALKKSIFEDKNLFGDLAIDKSTRQKIYDNIAKPVYKDPETGELYTAIQKYEKDNKEDFLKNLSILYTLTNGFKNIDGLVKGKVNKEVKKGIRELENVLNNTSRTSDGNLKFVSSVNDDPESFIGKGWNIDV